MKTLTDTQLSIISSFYLNEYEAQDILPMIQEAIISHDDIYLYIMWKGGIIDKFRKVWLTKGNRAIQCLAFCEK